jgi:RNA-binding protein YhbY
MGIIEEVQAICDQEYTKLPDARHTGDLYQIGFNSAIQHMVSEIEEVLAPYQLTTIQRRNMTESEKLEAKEYADEVFDSIGIYPAVFKMVILLVDKEAVKQRRAEVNVKINPGCRMKKKEIRRAIKEATEVKELKDFRIATPKEFAIWVIKKQIGDDFPSNLSVEGFPEKWPWEKSEKEENNA